MTVPTTCYELIAKDQDIELPIDGDGNIRKEGKKWRAIETLVFKLWEDAFREYKVHLKKEVIRVFEIEAMSEADRKKLYGARLLTVCIGPCV